MTKRQMLNEIEFSQQMVNQSDIDRAEERIGLTATIKNDVKLEIVAYVTGQQIYYTNSSKEGYHRCTFGNFIMRGDTNKNRRDVLAQQRDDRLGLKAVKLGIEYIIVEYNSAIDMKILNTKTNEITSLQYPAFKRWMKKAKERNMEATQHSYTKFEVTDSNGVKHMSL